MVLFSKNESVIVLNALRAQRAFFISKASNELEREIHEDSHNFLIKKIKDNTELY